MKREEEIKKQADIYTDDASNYAEWSDDGGWSDSNDIELIEKAFIEGAKWADEHPKEGLVSIDKACEYLESAIRPYMGYGTTSDFVDTFRKVMEK